MYTFIYRTIRRHGYADVTIPILIGRHIPKDVGLKLMLWIPTSPYCVSTLPWDIKYELSRHSKTHFVNYTSINTFSLLIDKWKISIFFDHFLPFYSKCSKCCRRVWTHACSRYFHAPIAAASTMFRCCPLRSSSSRSCLSASRLNVFLCCFSLCL